MPTMAKPGAWGKEKTARFPYKASTTSKLQYIPKGVVV
jgi:hypothetical protein